MRGVWFGLCLLASAGIAFYTLIFGGPIATVILLAPILPACAELCPQCGDNFQD
jgi:hypothetical protein